MIAFACSITKPDLYRRAAEPGIGRVAEPDSEVWSQPAVGSIFRSYNALLDRAAERDDLDALVLLHQDTEIVGHDFCARVREALSDPEVGLIGCVGAVGVRGIAWWDGSVTLASFVQRYDEHGGGDLPSLSWDWAEAPPYARLGEVETLDGFLLVLSPWVARNVRFDESLGNFHGYDLDFCLQVRAAKRKVVTADVRAIHHRSLDLIPDAEEWIAAHVAVADKWEGRTPGLAPWPGTWRDRARQAEAERDAAYALAASNELEGHAEARALERALADIRGSVSWRISAPLRALAGSRQAAGRH